MQVKICGITNEEDALAAVRAGADALGFIFHDKSPRFITPDKAILIIENLPPAIVTVGVFVNEATAVVRSIADYCPLDFIQLHGDESPAYCREFASSALIKAMDFKNDDDLIRAVQYPVAAVLADTRNDGLYGGTGKTANWDLAKKSGEKMPLILSGGLNAINIAQAMREVAPAALDINSGVETAPGKKDHAKLERIFKIIRDAEKQVTNKTNIFKKRKEQ